MLEQRARSAEFPNDNPALHSGTCWVCLEVCGPAIPERVPAPPPSPALDTRSLALGCHEEDAMPSEASWDEPMEMHEEDLDDGEAIEVVDEFEDFVVEDDDAHAAIEAVAAVEPIDANDPFSAFLCTLAEVALGAGGESVAALLPALLGDGDFDGSSLPEAAIDALLAAGLLERTARGVARCEGFNRTAGAWRCVLRGVSDDLSACGERTLDEWAADLVARLVAAPAKTEQLRRELRRRGVAAFGLVAA